MVKSKRYPIVLMSFILLLLIIFLWTLGTGRYGLNIISVVRIFVSKIIPIPKNWDATSESVLFTLRLPRAIAAILVGGSLAISGGAYQGVFKNPLVSPDMLGVSAGASVGAGCGILLNLGVVGIQASAFCGGMLAVFITSSLPKVLNNGSDIILVLSGIIVGGIMNSIMGLIKYIADSETQLPGIIYWQLGSLAKVMKRDVMIILPIIVISAILLIALSWRINILSLGEREAKSLGVNVVRTRGAIIIFSTLLTASSVCISGTIGWVGLVIPHLSRMIVGPDNVKMLPLSFILGSSFMLLIDTLSRVLTSAELPISILTGLVGAPFYLYLLVKQRMRLQ